MKKGKNSKKRKILQPKIKIASGLSRRIVSNTN